VANIQTSYYWPEQPQSLLVATAPLLRFVQTRIAGLTAQPIVLTNYYSQTYNAFSHNYFEQFVFEPRLEPGLPATTLAELEAANILWILVQAEGCRCKAIYALGYDQRFRAL
jgi:hypothetical protein